MPPSKKSNKAAKSIDFCSLPLTSSNFGSQSEIDAEVGTPPQWKTIATVYSAADVDAEDIANQIMLAMSGRPKMQAALDTALTCLEACRDCERLDAKIKANIKGAVESIQEITDEYGSRRAR
ncbi:MAG: hypothetical protein PHW76_02685 [Alphaproteobacteria bacterium]|nr:hypothetical protein [Alphaproteobacteria bacterium]